MVTFNLNQILAAILLVALIVLVIYLIILVSNTIQAVKKANTILDDGMTAVATLKSRVNDIKKAVAGSKVVNLADAGLRLVRVAVKKNK